LLQHDMRNEVARNAPAHRSNVVSHLPDVDGMTSGHPLAKLKLSYLRRPCERRGP
jgi:hypothetical protein